ncbi:MAG: DUF2293 domain-containing protein [Deltaproteobacteria bacterium]|nr:DUF2293 domain-containing protein [Deltaproteobacteria bacterium]MCB9488924.1 DUF2293 domain-containing protein [Deltaproteobacteria bacterium]
MSKWDTTCEECGENLKKGDRIWLDLKRKPHCLDCVELSHLVFLPTGNSALTRRAKKYSTLWAEVLKSNPSKQRTERQGLLVEDTALERAQQDCISDADPREARRERDHRRREIIDEEYTQRFTEEIRKLYPSCPAGREIEIAEHACMKYSGRVGRAADAKELNPSSVHLASHAHIRHMETGYDMLLAGGWGREDAREKFEARIEEIETAWSKPRNRHGREQAVDSHGEDTKK